MSVDKKRSTSLVSTEVAYIAGRQGVCVRGGGDEGGKKREGHRYTVIGKKSNEDEKQREGD